MNDHAHANPFATKPKQQLSRRAFSKGVFTAGLALGAAPTVLPNMLSAANLANAPTAGALRDIITQQLWAYSGETSLVSASEDEDFHGFLSQYLSDLQPIATL